MNSHIDPVWIWDRPSGRSVWLNTMRSTVTLLEEFQDAKFTCSSTALYRWLKETDPGLFRRIVLLADAGRWENVGGWEVQSDALISRAETLYRQAVLGQRFLRDNFGRAATIGYSPDAFGHCAELPKILQESGMDRYVFGRPKNALYLFHWRASDGSSVLAHHNPEYGHSAVITEADFKQRMRDQAALGGEVCDCMVGVGDHGGGVSRHHLQWIREMQQEAPELGIRFSTLGDFLQAADSAELPEFSGELGHVFRGCWTACHEVKRQIARATRRLLTAEKLGASAEELEPAWRELLFCHFHDSLPGTSIGRAYEQNIFPALGLVQNVADHAIDRELARRDTASDTSFVTEGGFQVWNPHPIPFTGVAAIDDFADPAVVGRDLNALCRRDGMMLPLQLMPCETAFGPCGDRWGRLTATVPLAPAALDEYAFTRVPEGHWPNLGFARQRALLARLKPVVFFDNSRTWGFTLEHFQEPLGFPQLTKVTEYVDGPVCSILRCEFSYMSSTIRMDLAAWRDIAELELDILLDWHETRTILKLALDHGLTEPALLRGAAAGVEIKELGKGWGNGWHDGRLNILYPNSTELPMQDWCAARDFQSAHVEGFYSADLHSCDHADNCLRLSLVRPVLHGDHSPFPQPEELNTWMDLGYTSLRLWYFETDVPASAIPAMAYARLNNAESRGITRHAAGEAVFHGLPLELKANTTVLLSQRREKDHWLLHLCNYGPEETILLNGQAVEMPAYALKLLEV
ncbi:MAG: hypothetical protein IJJ33_00235 [Victivallales bacterium]|nr:hypothetical protein [Victivallales bacterium]